MNQEFEPAGEKIEAESAPGCICGGAGPAVSRLVRAMAPPEGASEHFRKARVEVLKGLRELIDQRIESLSKPPAGKGTKVPVE